MMKKFLSSLPICLFFFVSSQSQTTEGIEVDMIRVESGTFMMGNEKGEEMERPVHKVSISTFFLGKFEVTQKLWEEIMGKNPAVDFICEDCPVIYVSWNDIQVFIEKLNKLTHKKYRLPTEAEWEYAARGGKNSTGYKYSGSNVLKDVAWYVANSNMRLHPVGMKLPNEIGIYDMNGNVWEWTNDFTGYDYYQYSPEINPKGPKSSNCNVIRGGCFIDNPSRISCTFRGHEFPNKRFSILGFRLAMDGN